MSGKREVVFDTETTGFDAWGEDRLTEIGCVEIIDLLPTGVEFHTYLNPQRDIPERVTEITGLTRQFLSDKPLFKTQAQSFLDFIGDSPLVAHNADFDRGFVNAELDRAGFSQIPTSRFTDTLQIAREKFPGSPASLDALCKRFDISLSSRDKHGAVIDAQLLAEVYLQLNGGRARSLGLDQDHSGDPLSVLVSVAEPRPEPLQSLLTEAETEMHRAFIDKMGEDMLWQKYWRRAAAQS